MGPDPEAAQQDLILISVQPWETTHSLEKLTHNIIITRLTDEIKPITISA